MVSAARLSHFCTPESRAIPRVSHATGATGAGAPARGAGKIRFKLAHQAKGAGLARFRTMSPLSKARKSQGPALPQIARRAVNSSMMLSAGYDDAHAVLEIEFVTGHVYRYHAVPRRDWQGLMDAQSKGRYFDANIRDKYPMKRVSST